MDDTDACPACGLSHSPNMGNVFLTAWMESQRHVSMVVNITVFPCISLHASIMPRNHLSPSPRWDLTSLSPWWSHWKTLLLPLTSNMVLDASSVKLNLYNLVLKLMVIDTNLNSGSGYSFPTPAQVEGLNRAWRHISLRQIFNLVGRWQFYKFPCRSWKRSVGSWVLQK